MGAQRALRVLAGEHPEPRIADGGAWAELSGAWSGAWGAAEGAAEAAWGYVEGSVAFDVGLLQGAWDAVWSTLTGLAGLVKLPFETVWALARDLITGTLVGKAKELWDAASKLNPGALVGAAGTLLGLALKDVLSKWNDSDAIKKWNFRGFVVGEVVVQVLLTFFSGGELLAARALSRVGGLADLIEHVGVMGQLREAAGALKGGAAGAGGGARVGGLDAQDSGGGAGGPQRGGYQPPAHAAAVAAGAPQPAQRPRPAQGAGLRLALPRQPQGGRGLADQPRRRRSTGRREALDDRG